MSNLTGGEYHGQCARVFERLNNSLEFHKAREKSLIWDIRELARKMDAIQGHTPQPMLGGKTLGGAVRALLIKE